MIMISFTLQHILIVVQQLVPRNVHLCKYIFSLWQSCGYLQFLSVTSGREFGLLQHGHDLLEHIQAIKTPAQSMQNESRKPQHRRTYIRHKCKISMR
jgi:hypothetical protein